MNFLFSLASSLGIASQSPSLGMSEDGACLAKSRTLQEEGLAGLPGASEEQGLTARGGLPGQEIGVEGPFHGRDRTKSVIRRQKFGRIL